MQPRAHGNSKRFVEDHPGQGDVGRIKPERHDTGTGGFESQKTLTPSICRSSSAKTCASPAGAVALATADPTKRIPAAKPAMPGRLIDRAGGEANPVAQDSPQMRLAVLLSTDNPQQYHRPGATAG